MARNGRNSNGKGRNGVPAWVIKWFKQSEEMMWDLETGHRDNQKEIKLSKERIEQNEKQIAELKKANEGQHQLNIKLEKANENQRQFNIMIAKKLGVINNGGKS